MAIVWEPYELRAAKRWTNQEGWAAKVEGRALPEAADRGIGVPVCWGGARRHADAEVGPASGVMPLVAAATARTFTICEGCCAAASGLSPDRRTWWAGLGATMRVSLHQYPDCAHGPVAHEP